MSKENSFDSYVEFESALNDLNDLATRINQTLEKTQRVYESQGDGWYSKNSNTQIEKMTNYIEDAKTIASNITTISNLARNFEQNSKNIDEEGSTGA